MTAIVRRATPADIGPILALGTADPAFGVSPRIRFYEREELAEWIAEPGENFLLVIGDAGEICGFCFAKRMSSHWAYLDNFYVRPGVRGHGHGRLLMQALLDLLQGEKIAYLSTLVAESDPFLAEYFRAGGMTPEKKYVWLERFVGDKTSGTSP
ncbi:GCN5-related N-acetyltransferase [Methanoregula boonei 6A8]|jgi:GNAT superfamily N-acetyltransferase|uniref:GCN5-related N-acetyltransferase n=1 Tax=Methanoregula boonei (strain DSM 21154 / JCM 14090 / 6A8) TaxID=456442 RepID=A7I6E1_METB6|nr:GNAT family N-acetyltransferase [Methanoregula boonei]ABS55302.1 GCN5-related N-acetyltransferase [Methanoregula boonei 6A8]